MTVTKKKLTKKKLGLAEVLVLLAGGEEPQVRVTAYDGSSAGPDDAALGVHLADPRGTRYLATSPGQLGMGRAYICGDLELRGVHPGDPYELLKALGDLEFKRPSPATLLDAIRSIGLGYLAPIAPPPLEAPPRWRRTVNGLRHSKTRDADAIGHHYDISNTFYEWLLGPSMTYSCGIYPTPDATLEEAQENKYRLIFEKLRLSAGDRLLDIGCGWGGMVRYAARRGVQGLGVSLSREQVAWAQKAIAEEGLSELAEVRLCDYRDITETGFDAISAIGVSEHIGVKNYPSYFGAIKDKLRTGGLMLNQCITTSDGSNYRDDGFNDRYIFPDGELTGSGRVITEIERTGLEVLHEENCRTHYAKTLSAWSQNLVTHWDDAVAEVGLARAKVWGLYIAASVLGFERNLCQLHQILAVKTDGRGGVGDLPQRPWWQPDDPATSPPGSSADQPKQTSPKTGTNHTGIDDSAGRVPGPQGDGA